MGAHLIDGEFQSDKYPTTPRGKVPLSVKDPSAQDLLWEYARRRRHVDGEFADDLETSLKAHGYTPGPTREHGTLSTQMWIRLLNILDALGPRTSEEITDAIRAIVHPPNGGR